MMSWVRQHGAAFSEALRNVVRGPGSFAVNVLVVAIALSLPFVGLTILDNIRPLSAEMAVEPEISIFMSMDTPRERSTALAQQIQRLLQDASTSAQLEFVPRERALSALNDRTGLSEAIIALGENPLPDGYVLRLGNVRNTGDAALVEVLAVQLKALPGVEYVQIDSAWVQRLAAMVQLMRLALLLLACTLAVVVVAVIFNTIRLQVITQREEIIVSRMFGATDAYICRPFYYSGALLGLAAGAFALIAVGLSLNPLNDAITEFARLYASEFRLAPLSIAWTLLLLGASTLLGLVGAVVSVRRQLNRIS